MNNSETLSNRTNFYNIDLPLMLDGSLLTTNSAVQYYGNLSFGFPTGRPNDAESVEIESFISLVLDIKNKGDEFNFLLNGSLGSLEVNSFNKYLEWVVQEVNPAIITFSDSRVYHYLVEKYNYSSFEVSAIVGIKTLKDFVNYLNRNDIDISHIRKLVLHHDITQNYKQSRSLIEYLISNQIEPRVLVTESCYCHCPLRKLHYNSFISSYRDKNETFINHYQIHCMAKRLLEPVSLLDLSGFLLPEQLNDYSMKTGIDCFKLSGRSKSASWIYNTAQHYLTGISPLNLFEILVFTSPFLDEIGIDFEDLFYLDSKEYLRIHDEICQIQNQSERMELLRKKATRLFQLGLLEIKDPGSIYDIVNGELTLIRPGEYLNQLISRADLNLQGTVFHQLRAM